MKNNNLHNIILLVRKIKPTCSYIFPFLIIQNEIQVIHHIFFTAFETKDLHLTKYLNKHFYKTTKLISVTLLHIAVLNYI